MDHKRIIKEWLDFDIPLIPYSLDIYGLENLIYRKARVNDNAPVIFDLPKNKKKTNICFHFINELIENEIPKKDILYLDFDSSKLKNATKADLDAFLKEFRNLHTESDRLYFIFEELQKVDNWKAWLLQVNENMKNINFVLANRKGDDVLEAVCYHYHKDRAHEKDPTPPIQIIEWLSRIAIFIFMLLVSFCLYNNPSLIYAFYHAPSLISSLVLYLLVVPSFLYLTAFCVSGASAITSCPDATIGDRFISRQIRKFLLCLPSSFFVAFMLIVYVLNFQIVFEKGFYIIFLDVLSFALLLIYWKFISGKPVYDNLRPLTNCLLNAILIILLASHAIFFLTNTFEGWQISGILLFPFTFIQILFEFLIIFKALDLGQFPYWNTFDASSSIAFYANGAYFIGLILALLLGPFFSWCSSFI